MRRFKAATGGQLGSKRAVRASAWAFAGVALVVAGFWGAVAVAGSLTSESTDAEVRSTNRSVSPLAGARKSEESWVEGRVDAVHQVPGYTYVELTSRSGDTLVIATLKRKVEVGANVQARLVAERTNFPSRHLGRTFPVLHFGVVTMSLTPALPVSEHR